MSKMKTPEELAEEYVISKPFHCVNDAFVAGYHAALNSEAVKRLVESIRLCPDWLREGAKNHRWNGNFYSVAKQCENALAQFEALTKTESEA